ncbi:MAG: hypothetical protein GC201_15265 [Alphaproteobacteria bacterium]|nr:hypothetical protein [Alphaproteobacteria bacterium]
MGLLQIVVVAQAMAWPVAVDGDTVEPRTQAFVTREAAQATAAVVMPERFARPVGIDLSPGPTPGEARHASDGEAVGFRDPPLLARHAGGWRDENRLRFAVDEGSIRYGLWADVREIDNLAGYETGTPPAGGAWAREGLPGRVRPAAAFTFSDGPTLHGSDLSYTEYRGGMFIAAPF